MGSRCAVRVCNLRSGTSDGQTHASGHTKLEKDTKPPILPFLRLLEYSLICSPPTEYFWLSSSLLKVCGACYRVAHDDSSHSLNGAASRTPDHPETPETTSCAVQPSDPSILCRATA
ncbi:hypothetical protein LMH87_005056 [Akanthomyces muscarius]|uniref:Uncharacterized protein n=1 Tax=Akanthomyces muscarius TaxID=2231603 RepID=A0A9W8QKL7_AKAMU|nr:hypothetical protein LMH87_005056 [Akanthomyces muscarius]KAJ4163319.1 hypothetical protein LMH87_005056 [Akanthomyces muscarius]